MTGNTERFNPQFKMLYHADRIAAWLAGERPQPILVEIDPTSRCNANCPWCSYVGRQQWMVQTAGTRSDIDPEVLMRALLQMRNIGVKAINWTGGGEPTLHPDLRRFVCHAWDIGLRQGLFTNAIARGKWVGSHNGSVAHCLDWIRVSLTDKYIDGIDKSLLRVYVESAPTGICMNLTPDNVGLADEMCRQARDLGVAYFQVRPALQRTWRQQPLIDVPWQLKRHETEDFRVFLSPYKFSDCHADKSYVKCMAGAFVPVVDYWGNVRRCNYHLNDEGEIIGNLSDGSFAEIMARMPLERPVREDCQTCCKNHELNKLLDGLAHLTDVDFI